MSGIALYKLQKEVSFTQQLFGLEERKRIALVYKHFH